MIPKSGISAGEGIGYPFQYSWASLVAQLVKNPPAVQETWVRPLGWPIPWRRESLPSPASWAGEFHELYSPWGRKESDTTERLSLSKHINSHVVLRTQLDHRFESTLSVVKSDGGVYDCKRILRKYGFKT